MRQFTDEKDYGDYIREAIRTTLVGMKDRIRIKNSEIATACDWWTKDDKPYESRVSGYMSKNKFSMDGIAWICLKNFDMTFDELVRAAIGVETVEQVEIARATKELTPAQNQMVRDYALQLAEFNRAQDKSKAQIQQLRKQLREK